MVIDHKPFIISGVGAASGHAIHVLARLIRLYGKGNWRKLKGLATVRLEDGTITEAEVHWFEAHGIGKRRMKIKRLLYLP